MKDNQIISAMQDRLMALKKPDTPTHSPFREIPVYIYWAGWTATEEAVKRTATLSSRALSPVVNGVKRLENAYTTPMRIAAAAVGIAIFGAMTESIKSGQTDETTFIKLVFDVSFTVGNAALIYYKFH